MKHKFPLEHVVNYNTQEIWVLCDSAITAMGLPALVKQYYPGYKPKIGTKEQLNKLRNQLVN
jgi:hypothetical protein